MPKLHVVIGGLGITLAVLVGVILLSVITTDEQALIGQTNQKVTSLIDEEKFRSLEQISRSDIDTTHLADGVVPPTNKWYSSMVLNKEPLPGFNVPNSILLHDTGFELGLPEITTTGEGIYGPHRNGIQVDVQGASSYRLTYYDELVITLSYYNDAKKKLFDVTFASGSPYGFITAHQDIKGTLRSGPASSDSNGVTTFKNGGVWYGAKSTNGATGKDISLQANEQLAVFSASKHEDVTALSKAADSPIISGKVNYERQNEQIKTTLSYKTTKGGKTMLVRMPHQASEGVGSEALTYSSLYGELNAYAANEISYVQPVQQIKWALDLDTISSDDRSALADQLARDIDNTQLDKRDTYFGGKQLQRVAQLAMVAESIKDTRQRDAAIEELVPVLSAWFDENKTEKSFYYDTTAQSIVGREASFGSDKELNDHHFHYGYFIYAASVAAKYDKAFLDTHREDINLLVADIANYKKDELLPLRRTFDAYGGHSWASGIAKYSDGNNQESSAEAVNAWTGVGLWAQVTENQALEQQAEWLLANEVATAKQYWLTASTAKGYTSPLVAINWGGKREYKTFFSDEPNAKLAIQLLPLTPTMKPYIESLPANIFAGTDTKKLYGDYILMADARKAATAVREHSDTLIDDGNSRAYMYAVKLAK